MIMAKRKVKVQHNRRASDRAESNSVLTGDNSLNMHTAYTQDYYRGHSQGFAEGQRHHAVMAQREAAVRADEKAVFFSASGNMPVRNADDRTLIQKYIHHAEQAARLRAEIAPHTYLLKSIEQEMKYRGLIHPAINNG